MAFSWLSQNQDTDGDGWDDQYDSDDGGTAIVLSNKELVGSPRLFRLTTPTVMAFQIGLKGLTPMKTVTQMMTSSLEHIFMNEIIMLVFTSMNTISMKILSLDWLEDNNSNGIPNFLDPLDGYYRDTDNDGFN